MSYYMNLETGSVDTYEGWWYENTEGEKMNAVDEGEVVEVEDDGCGYWRPVWGQ